MALKMKTLKYLGHSFESSSRKTEEFIQFSRDWRSDLKAMVKGSNWNVHSVSVGHFYISAFLHNPFTNKWVYVSISDVRFFINEWFNQMLFRIAKDDKDCTGGRNCFSRFDKLLEVLDKL